MRIMAYGTNRPDYVERKRLTDGVCFLEIDFECKSCNGTGIYVGVCARDGAGGVCEFCHGTGCYTFIFCGKKFTGRKIRKDIKRVYSAADVNTVVVCPHDVTTDKGVTLEFSKAGCTYEEWLSGMIPTPVKGLEAARESIRRLKSTDFPARN